MGTWKEEIPSTGKSMWTHPKINYKHWNEKRARGPRLQQLVGAISIEPPGTELPQWRGLLMETGPAGSVGHLLRQLWFFQPLTPYSCRYQNLVSRVICMLCDSNFKLRDVKQSLVQLHRTAYEIILNSPHFPLRRKFPGVTIGHF